MRGEEEDEVLESVISLSFNCNSKIIDFVKVDEKRSWPIANETYSNNDNLSIAL